LGIGAGAIGKANAPELYAETGIAAGGEDKVTGLENPGLEYPGLEYPGPAKTGLEYPGPAKTGRATV